MRPRFDFAAPSALRARLAQNAFLSSLPSSAVRFESSRATVALQPDWQILSGLTTLGDVLAIVPNPFAILGRVGPYPELHWFECGHGAVTRDGTAEFCFSSWSSALAAVEPQPGGWLYSIEFRDTQGDVVHRVCLTPDSRFDAFADLVRCHLGVAGRPPWHFDRCADAACPCEDPSPRVGSGVVRALLDRLAALGHSFRAVTGNDGVVLGADISARTLKSSDEWAFAGGPDAGIHLRVGAMHDVRLGEVPAASQRLLLKAFDSDGRIAVALTAPTGATWWDALVREVSQPFLKTCTNDT